PGGGMNHLTRNGEELDLHLESTSTAEMDGKHVEKKRAIVLGVDGEQASPNLARHTVVKRHEIGRLSAERGAVIDDLDTDLAAIVVDLDHSNLETKPATRNRTCERTTPSPRRVDSASSNPRALYFPSSPRVNPQGDRHRLVQRPNRVNSQPTPGDRGKLREIFFIFVRNYDFIDLVSKRRKQFFLDSPDWHHASAQGDLPGDGNVVTNGGAGGQGKQRDGHGHAGGRTVLGNGAGGDVDVDLVAREKVRFHVPRRSPRPHPGQGGARTLLHHVAEVAGERQTGAAGDGRRLHVQGLAPRLRPGQARDHADQIFPSGRILEVSRRAEEGLQPRRRDADGPAF